jgi:hypothetical protein
MVFTIESEAVEFDKPAIYKTSINNADFSGDITYRLDTVDGAIRLVSEADMTYRGNTVARFSRADGCAPQPCRQEGAHSACRIGLMLPTHNRADGT